MGVSFNNEYTLEFWVFIYSYVPAKFTSLDIIWNQHAQITIITLGIQLFTRCYAFVELNGAPYNYYTDGLITEGKWFNVRCAINLFTKKYYVNKNSEQTISPDIPTFVKTNPTTMTIEDKMNGANNNYGFSFIKEIKLWSSYLFPHYDTSRM